MSGLFFPLRREGDWPHWYKALTISGKPAGLGFYCDRCHLHVRYGAEAGVFHCGALETAPRFTALLPTRRLGHDSGLLPSNIIPAFGWDEHEEEKPHGKLPIFG